MPWCPSGRGGEAQIEAGSMRVKGGFSAGFAMRNYYHGFGHSCENRLVGSFDCGGAWRAILYRRRRSMSASFELVETWRRIMKALVAALALATLIAMPAFTQSANAAPMSPSSSSFGSNGY
jgi:hypothetical protein